jgi:pimeloyl-ACP methyl ester carboxylesterase
MDRLRSCSPDGVPLVLNQHFTGTMDYWDPAVTDGLARDREVILFNNAGVSSSSGEVPTTFEEMGANAVAFIKALGLTQVDVLGISIGVRRLILVGTGPRGGQGMATLTPAAQEIFGGTYDEPDHLWLHAVRESPMNADPTIMAGITEPLGTSGTIKGGRNISPLSSSISWANPFWKWAPALAITRIISWTVTARSSALRRGARIANCLANPCRRSRLPATARLHAGNLFRAMWNR